MRYKIELKPRATKDLQRIPKHDASKVFAALERLCDNLTGNVKRLAEFTPQYRLRVGDYRALFNVEGNRVVVFRVCRRRDAYRG